jgi:hypothetical protein
VALVVCAVGAGWVLKGRADRPPRRTVEEKAACSAFYRLLETRAMLQRGEPIGGENEQFPSATPGEDQVRDAKRAAQVFSDAAAAVADRHPDIEHRGTEVAVETAQQAKVGVRPNLANHESDIAAVAAVCGTLGLRP